MGYYVELKKKKKKLKKKLAKHDSLSKLFIDCVYPLK